MIIKSEKEKQIEKYQSMCGWRYLKSREIRGPEKQKEKKNRRKTEGKTEKQTNYAHQNRNN